MPIYLPSPWALTIQAGDPLPKFL